MMPICLQLRRCAWRCEMKRGKSGFTIVELMVVVAIIAILAGAITMGLNGMFYKSRVSRAMALRSIMQSGLETYYAQRGEWPGKLKDISEDPKFDKDEDYYTLTLAEMDECFAEIVKESWGTRRAPAMDISGLFAIRKSRLVSEYGCTDIHRSWKNARERGVVVESGIEERARDHKCSGKCAYGRDFSEAIKKGATDRFTSTDGIVFGYPGPNHGRFCRFRVQYYPKSDTVKVLLQRATEWSDGARRREGYIDD